MPSIRLKSTTKTTFTARKVSDMMLSLVTAVLAGVILNASSVFERRTLDPPALLKFRAEDHFSRPYRESLEALGKAVEAFDSAALRKEYAIFRETLDQETVRACIYRITAGVYKYPVQAKAKTDEGPLRERLRSAAAEVSTIIEAGAYVGGVPLEMKTNQGARQYEVRWREWNGASWTGKIEERAVPFVPRMRIIVSARYDSSGGRSAYGYRIQNDQESEGSIRQLMVECKGLTSARLEMLSGKWSFDIGHYTIFMPARGFMQDFRFFTFDDKRMGVAAKPGEELVYPPILTVPWNQLPGLVRCWVSAGDYIHGLDPEVTAENVLKVFTAYNIVETPEMGPKKEPKYMYHGITIGPVPWPGSDVTEKMFIDKIVGYMEGAREWDWIRNQQVADIIKSWILALAKEDKRSDVGGILDMCERAYKKGDILEEAYVLIKYNLSFLTEHYHR